MTTQFIKLENVDFTQYPENIDPQLNTNNAQFYCGDCTNNPVMFLHHLVQWGIVEITAEDFKNFSLQVEQYPMNFKEMKNVVNLFHNFLKKVQIHNNGATVHIIGPLLYELTNKGITLKDYFILKIIEKLNNAGQKLSILFNYQTYRFLQLHEAVISNTTTEPYSQDDAVIATLISKYITHKVIPLKAFKALVEEHFLPHLKLINYTINAAQTEITIISPTPINLSVIDGLAHMFGIPFDDSSVQRLMVTLDRLMVHFKSWSISRFPFNHDSIQGFYHRGDIDSASFPLETCITSRIQNAEKMVLNSLNETPCNVTWLHGQVSNSITLSNFENVEGSPNICLYTQASDESARCYIAYSKDEAPSLMLDQIDSINTIPQQLQNNIFAKMHARFLDISLFGGHRDQQLLDFAKIYETLETTYNTANADNREKELFLALSLYFETPCLKSTGKYMALRQELKKLLYDEESSLEAAFEAYKDWIDLLKEKYPFISKPKKHTHSEILHWILKENLKEVNIVSRVYHL